jgi:predicted flap endonuclease-1-like 5' DNA nuclease/predicted nuclease with TOPRIM domain
MLALFDSHSALTLLAVFVGGMLFKWLLDLFWLRAHILDTRHRLATRERELTDARHEHARTASDLKNRLIELDATQKSRIAAEQAAQNRAAEITALEGRLNAAQETAARARAELAAAHTAGENARAESSRLQRELDALRAELDDATGRLTDFELRFREAQAREATDGNALAELRNARDEFSSAQDQSFARLAHLEKSAAAQESVHAHLQAALLSRDTSISGLKSQLADTETERASVARALASDDERITNLEAQLAIAAQQRTEHDRVRSQLAAIEAQLTTARSQADAAGRAKAAAEASLRKRDLELGDLERRAQEFQSAFDDAAKENARITQELNRVNAHDGATSAALKQLEAEHAGAQQRLTALATEISSLRQQRAGAAEAEVATLRTEAAQLRASLAAAQQSKIATEAELAAVSRSHAQLEHEIAGARREIETFNARAPAAAAPSSGPASESLLAEIDALSRERNELAAELASLRAMPDNARRKRPAPADADEVDAGVEEFVAACPQHLSDVKGIGSVFETRLYAAGIGSYWELARLSEARLADILELTDHQRDSFDFSATRADARRLASETKSAGRKWSREQPDDFEPITGIGPAFEKRLYDAGICTYETLASTNVERLAEICPGSSVKRPDYAAWITQARQFADARQT